MENSKSFIELMKNSAFELLKEEKIDNLNSTGLILKHKKSGARVVILSNDDDNKVFTIGFRTPPSDSTGVAHILEHSVLCGSKEFPSKDPFVELVKGSLNTFLNAMTYPDKTVYPVASCNDKDFQNLMHVYLDAVFFPNIYTKKEIFLQEGWHYELEKEEDEIIINGVVYNEMKGVFSSPDQQLYRTISKSLFPDTPYGVESGGDPDDIPNLTYEEFLDFHKKYYHPSNSYIYLYGNMDVMEKLEFIDREYLSKFDEEEVDSTISLQKAFGNTKEIKEYYSVSDSGELIDKTYLSYNMVVGDSLDKELYLAFQILEYVLLSSPGAPLKQALIDAGIGKDILSSYDNGTIQPVFSMIAKNTEEEKKEEFIKIINETLEELVKKGIEEKSLLAAINYYEFKYREGDYGSYPKGLMYGLQIFDSWLYDETKPFIHIEADETFELLKKNVGTNYYESLIEKYLLENPHSSIVIIKPKVGLTTEINNELKKTLRDYKETLTKDEIKQLVEETKGLKKFQEEPSTKEELEKIPLLSREDINKEAKPLYNEIKEAYGVKVIHHNINTNGICYLRFLFDVDKVPTELTQYIGLLSSVLGYIDTTKHSFLDLSNEINIHTGGIKTDVNMYGKRGSIDVFSGKFEIITKVLYPNMSYALEFMNEMIHESKISDEKRLLEIISEIKSKLQSRMNANGHSVAVNRALSYFSKGAFFNELVSGIAYYQFIDELEKDFQNKKAVIINNLKLLITCIFRKENFMISCTANDTGYAEFEKFVQPFVNNLEQKPITSKMGPFNPVKLNEGFKTSGKVQYVARTGNFIKAGYQYTGALKVLKLILGYDYLWKNIRVKGGAYGCMCGFTLEGNGYFTSYRDPNLRETNDIYERIYEYIKEFSADERDMTKYVIGTMSGIDTPLNPSAIGYRSLTSYLSNITIEDIQKSRDQVLSATAKDIRELADLVRAVLDANDICVIGNEDKIEENKELFYSTKNLM